jgi:hypothetical protein
VPACADSFNRHSPDLSELGKILADPAPPCQRRAVVAERNGAEAAPVKRGSIGVAAAAILETATAAIIAHCLDRRALYIPEATQAAEISPNFRPQIGLIGALVCSATDWAA